MHRGPSAGLWLFKTGQKVEKRVGAEMMDKRGDKYETGEGNCAEV